MSPKYQIGIAIKQKLIPAKKHKADIKYIIIVGIFNLARIYVSGPISIVKSTTIDAARAKLAIIHLPHPHNSHNPRLHNLRHHKDSILCYIFLLLPPYVLR